MRNFKDADEVFRYVGGMFEAALTMDQIVEATKDANLVVRLRVTDPDCEMLVDFPGGRVLLGSEGSGVESTVDLTMSGENSNKFWQGKLNFTLALAQRKVKLEGSRSVAMKLLPMTGPLFGAYRGILEGESRDDLLIR